MSGFRSSKRLQVSEPKSLLCLILGHGADEPTSNRWAMSSCRRSMSAAMAPTRSAQVWPRPPGPPEDQVASGAGRAALVDDQEVPLPKRGVGSIGEGSHSPAAFAEVDALLAPVAGGARPEPSAVSPIYDGSRPRAAREADPGSWRQRCSSSPPATSRSGSARHLASRGPWPCRGLRGTATGLLVVRRRSSTDFYPQLIRDSEPLGYRRALLDWIDTSCRSYSSPPR